MSIPKVTVVGGGFTGCSIAIHLLKNSSIPLRICIVEPREQLAEGLAFSSAHVDHRLNGAASGHTALPDDPAHLTRWCQRTRLLEQDPEAANGDAIFLRRKDFARYVRETLEELQRSCSVGVSLEHLRDDATELRRDGDRYVVLTRRSGEMDSDMVAVATGNPPRANPPILEPLQGTGHFVADPYDLEGLRRIAQSSSVLVVGTGLTAMDVACALIRQGHRGPITMISRRGLRPREHSRRLSSAKDTLARINGPIPSYLSEGSPSVRSWLSGLRHAIRTATEQGGDWQAPFDELRDVVWKLWPTLPTSEQRRFSRHLRTWYDAHRFRVPAPTHAIVSAAEASGQARVLRKRLARVRLDGSKVAVTFGDGSAGNYDAVVNATGFALEEKNPFLGSAVKAGLLLPAKNGMGLAVDENCRALDASAIPQPNLRIFGPPTVGQFGDPVGTIFIGAHVAQAIADMLVSLQCPGHSSAQKAQAGR